ncbi:MAG TPA: hypothetical protein GXX20_00260 [Clostridiaceae bacterium]|nr:hypothetical protein [Clostridiaceae bacterium]
MVAVNRKAITLGGILAAITVILLYVESITPTVKLSLYVLSSFFSAVMIIEGGLRSGWIFYLVTSILAFIIVPDKIGLIPYFLFFGTYGILKSYIERIGKIVSEYVLKVLFFNICLALAFIIIRIFFIAQLNDSISLWFIIIVMEVVFIIYDYVYTLFIQYYVEKLKKVR